MSEPEIGHPTARHHIEKDAAAAGDFGHIGQPASLRPHRNCERLRLEVVIAGNCVPWCGQSRHLVVDDAELFKRAVVRVVAGQNYKIDSTADIRVHLIHDATQIKMVLQASLGDMQSPMCRNLSGL